MCGHVFMYHDPHHFQHRRPVWRCGACGREAFVPLDCCARPDFTSVRSATFGTRCAQGLVALRRWVLTSLGVVLGRFSHLAGPSMMEPDDNGAENITAASHICGGDDSVETAVMVGASAADEESV